MAHYAYMWTIFSTSVISCNMKFKCIIAKAIRFLSAHDSENMREVHAIFKVWRMWYLCFLTNLGWLWRIMEYWDYVGYMSREIKIYYLNKILYKSFKTNLHMTLRSWHYTEGKFYRCVNILQRYLHSETYLYIEKNIMERIVNLYTKRVSS